jgi:hypothetical protein
MVARNVLRTGFDLLDISSAGPLEGRLNLLLSDRPFSKTCFIAKLVKSALENGWVVHYLDLDTFFTVYKRLNLLNLPYSENLRIYNSEMDTLNKDISVVCSTSTKKPQFIILDSLPAFYDIFAGRSRSSEVNWRIGLYIALLMHHIKVNKGAILAASLLRSKKIKEDTWIPSYPGGMLMRAGSSTIYELREKSNFIIELKVIKHEKKDIEGRVWSLPLTF